MSNVWVLASSNRGKLDEFKSLLSPFDVEVIPQNQVAAPSVQETGETFVENAILKARACSSHSGYPALADDSGLIIDALQGKPGVKSARYAGENADDISNRQLVIEQLNNLPTNEQPFSARFVCVLAFMRFSQDPVPIIAQGELEGEIVLSAQGDQGFGYDPIFWLPQLQCTAAQLQPDKKNQLSHRGRALRQLCKQISG